MMTSEDVKRTKDNDMKTMWFNKLIELGKQYNMSDYVTRKLIH